MERKKVVYHHLSKLILLSILVGIFCTLLTYSLKVITEHSEEFIFSWISKHQPLLFLIAPSLGITIIYFLRKYLFKNRKNKGITEIYKTLDLRKDHLPSFKIPSHFLNGFLTVIFGGSTGIEVSTVVATATVGNLAYEREFSARQYKRELICAGVTAGVAILFGSALVGILFAIEVIARNRRKTILLSCLASGLVAFLGIQILDIHPFFQYKIETWNWYAIPFVLILGLLGGLFSVYFTVLVIKIKTFFTGIDNNFLRVNIGALIVGLSILFIPILYGDSYLGLHEFVEQIRENKEVSLLIIVLLVFLKPIVSSFTLGAGGDGGVFAPSIVAGAFLGMAFSIFCNQYLGSNLIVYNFIIIGVAAALSGSISAPVTALFLACSMAPNGFALFFPVMLASFSARFLASKILPYNVYTYGLSSK